MGLFLQLAGIAGSSLTEVERALNAYAATSGTIFESLDTHRVESDTLIIKESASHKISLLYFGDFAYWQKASTFLSETLESPVIFLHIHDSALWVYVLFVQGQIVDAFNPIPDYWDDSLSEEEQNSWKGNAATLCQNWPNLKESEVQKYLIRWNNPAANKNRYAYPGNIFRTGDEWQMLDFMGSLGLVYPVSYPFDITGEPLGKLYRFRPSGI